MAVIAGGCQQEDLEKAMAIVDKGERVLAVWKATPEQAQSAACQPFQIVFSSCRASSRTSSFFLLAHARVSWVGHRLSLECRDGARPQYSQPHFVSISAQRGPVLSAQGARRTSRIRCGS
jgi:hypothetical protein